MHPKCTSLSSPSSTYLYISKYYVFSFKNRVNKINNGLQVSIIKKYLPNFNVA